ncbi:oxidoreductase [Labilibaculum sp. A4]|uniref:ferredoxin--NADP reductase n=1 Tax=Labilibaculum euxinus TaxID=2686357 RepID=UPI000F623554|nr:oxidoreductase [Labilibaculum euxinus]MDQ1771258.1 oxidoreductase [Labilibaculum euxinus]MWN77045.1 oxidoreductase [Labilibaculum euxinus]
MESITEQKNKLSTTIVIENKAIAPGVFVLKYKKVKSFTAGQYIGLTTDLSITPRLYTIASGENDTEVQVLYNLKDDGWLTPRLSEIKPGSELYVTNPDGDFIDDESPAWWIASGTGIAPYAAMFRSGLLKNKTLIHGGRYHHSFYFEKEFIPVLKENYIRCCSQDEAEGLYHGRLTRYLQDVKKLPENCRFFLCGSPEMVVEVRDLLIKRGVEYERIVAEIYF